MSVINFSTWKKLDKLTLKKSSKGARTVTGDEIKFEGEVILPINLNGTTKKLKIFVIKESENLLGTDFIEKFNL